MTEEQDIAFNKLVDNLVNHSDGLIKDGVRENKLSLTNGFDVIFRDRKKKR